MGCCSQPFRGNTLNTLIRLSSTAVRPTDTLTHAYTYIVTHTHAGTISTHTETQTHTHACRQASTHTQTHTQIYGNAHRNTTTHVNSHTRTQETNPNDVCSPLVLQHEVRPSAAHETMQKKNKEAVGVGTSTDARGHVCSGDAVHVPPQTG